MYLGRTPSLGDCMKLHVSMHLSLRIPCPFRAQEFTYWDSVPWQTSKLQNDSSHGARNGTGAHGERVNSDGRITTPHEKALLPTKRGPRITMGSSKVHAGRWRIPMTLGSILSCLRVQNGHDVHSFEIFLVLFYLDSIHQSEKPGDSRPQVFAFPDRHIAYTHIIF